MQVLFIGCVESSFILLKELIENEINICGVVTKRNSHANSDFKDLTPLCNQYNIDYYYTKSSNDSDTISFIKKSNPDIIYCLGWSHILSEEIINIPELGVLGFHPAKLPQNKGRHPLIWALVLGLKRTASTFFLIDKYVDNGDIVSQEDILISINDNARTLYDKVMEIAKHQIIDITYKMSSGNIKYISQNLRKGNIWRKRTKKDGKIDFRMSSMAIYNLVRGLTKPYVGAHFEYEGNDYKVWSAELVTKNLDFYKNIEPGKIIEVYSEKSFMVKTGDGLIIINDSDKIDISRGDYL